MSDRTTKWNLDDYTSIFKVVFLDDTGDKIPGVKDEIVIAMSIEKAVAKIARRLIQSRHTMDKDITGFYVMPYYPET